MTTRRLLVWIGLAVLEALPIGCLTAAGQLMFVEAHSLPDLEAPTASEKCPELPLKENSLLTAAKVIELLGNTPKEYVLKPQGHNRILILHKLDSAADPLTTASIKENIDRLASVREFSIDLTVPHSSALGDVAAAMKTLSYDDFTITNTSPGQIHIVSGSVPACSIWTRFLGDMRRIAWNPTPVSPVQKVFYLDAKEVSAALNGSETTPVGGDKSKDKGKGADDGSKGAAQTDGSSQIGLDTFRPSPGVIIAEPVAFRPGAQGKSKGETGGTKDDSGDKSQKQDSAATQPAGPEAKPTQSASAPGAPPDLLVYSEPTPGNDAAVLEKNRVVASLDLPRPEMVINVWSLQVSSSNPEKVEDTRKRIQDTVDTFNGFLEKSIVIGWECLKEQMGSTQSIDGSPTGKTDKRPPCVATQARNQAGNPSFFDESYFRYIAYRHVAEPDAQAAGNVSFEQASQAVLDRGRQSGTLRKEIRDDLGICGANEYCLGYSQLFQPLKPRLTDLLLTVIAARSPLEATEQAINRMENLPDAPVIGEKTCREFDMTGPNSPPSQYQPYFECFREVANAIFRSGSAPDALGLLRGATADFLFNYKMSEQYPHEFSPYNLSQSAQALNTALSPLVDAFETDVAAYQQRLQQVVAKALGSESGSFKEDRKTFTNNGTVTVRTVSGKETVVDTVSQSYMDVSSAPSLTDVISSIQQTGGSNSPVPALLAKNLPGAQGATVLGALNALQSSQAKIGRGLKIDITPRTLAGAASAELDVVMTVEESPDGQRYTGSNHSDDNYSRVSKHDTTTKIRVDSLKIVDVSSLTAALSRSRSRFPLLPIPGLEIPYIGSLIGWPIPPSKEYHASVGVLSAMVVPTAADLAYGLAFMSDRLLESNTGCTSIDLTKCSFRTAKSIHDLNQQPIVGFHRAMINCLMTGMGTAHPRLQPLPTVPSPQCTKLTFNAIEREAN